VIRRAADLLVFFFLISRRFYPANPFAPIPFGKDALASGFFQQVLGVEILLKGRYARVANPLGHEVYSKGSKSLLGIVHLITDELLDGKHPILREKTGCWVR
jgi:hypothetical protein